MNSKYKIVLIISGLILTLSIVISIINYSVSLKNAHTQLKNQSLPLTLDNIYTDIQKHIIEPYLVSSMMANDTFVQDWILHDEESDVKIIKYLETIKNKYNMFNTFLVSDVSKKYYTQNGYIETISKDAKKDSWYFDFKNLQKKHEINLDFNKKLSNNLIMFINYKIFDSSYKFLGATGVAIQISYIDDLLKDFRVNHNFRVSFFNSNGEVVLAEEDIRQYKTIENIPQMNKYKEKILLKNSSFIEYSKNGSDHILNTKYIPELDLYLIVEANLDDFTKDLKSIFYFNIIVSVFISLLISFMVLFIIKKYSSRLEYLSHYDPLTDISNRRDFESKLNHQIPLHRRKNADLALVFLDIDNFKSINDTFGHQKGDEVLKQTAHILKEHIRSTDLVARWGGEEFIIAFIETDIDDITNTVEKLRQAIEENVTLTQITGTKITGSFGVTILKSNDTISSFISRADELMYQSKQNGKNRCTTDLL